MNDKLKFSKLKMNNISKLVFYHIVKYLSDKDIINLCYTRQKFLKIFDDKFFQEKFFKRYENINETKFNRKKIDLIKQVMDGHGNVHIYDIKTQQTYNMECDAAKIIMGGRFILRLTKDGELYPLIDLKRYYSRIEKYYERFNELIPGKIMAENILDVFGTLLYGIILMKDFKLYEVIVVTGDHDWTYRLKWIADNVIRIGGNNTNLYYFTTNGDLYIKGYLYDENYKLVSSNVKLVSSRDCRYYVDIFNTLHYYDGGDIRKKYDQNVVDIYSLIDVHLFDGTAIYGSNKLDKKFIKINCDDHMVGITDNLDLYLVYNQYSPRLKKIAENVINAYQYENYVIFMTLPCTTIS